MSSTLHRCAFSLICFHLAPVSLQVTPVDMGGNTILHVTVQRGKYDVVVRVSVHACVCVWRADTDTKSHLLGLTKMHQ